MIAPILPSGPSNHVSIFAIADPTWAPLSPLFLLPEPDAASGSAGPVLHAPVVLSIFHLLSCFPSPLPPSSLLLSSLLFPIPLQTLHKVLSHTPGYTTMLDHLGLILTPPPTR